ncbi:MAG: tetratricopeptide repeat protein [Firmicutes bacterium]|nr:tetratricopeptide repeat protein [Bacillota bacterium]
MFFDRRRLKKQARVIFVILIIVLSAGLIMSSMQWANAPTQTAGKQQQSMTQEELEKYFQEKIDELENNLKDNPEDTKTLSELASLYMISGKGDKAVTTYKKLIELQPDNVEVKLNLASLYFNQQQYDKAKDQINQALQIQPDNLNARMNLATIYFYDNKFEEAEKEVKKVLEASEDNAGAHQLYAYIMANGKEDYKSAVEEIDKFIELEKEGPAVEQAKEIKKDWQEKIKE